MSLDTFDFPDLKAVRSENPTLYYGLLTFMETLPGGPWRYKEGYDPSPNGERYAFILKNLFHPDQLLSVCAEKNNGDFSFSVNAGPEH